MIQLPITLNDTCLLQLPEDNCLASSDTMTMQQLSLAGFSLVQHHKGGMQSEGAGADRLWQASKWKQSRCWWSPVESRQDR